MLIHADLVLAMKTIDPQARLEESYPGPTSPPPSPDGGPTLEPAPVRLPVLTPITRCELGPCRNYHRLVTRFDAQNPLDGDHVLYTTTTHTCYPAMGIEVDLSDSPVKECNRWEPIPRRERHEVETMDAHYAAHDERAARELAEFNASWEALPVTEESDAGIG